MKRILKWLLLGLLAAFLAIQFVRPDHDAPAVDPSATLRARFEPPPEVERLLRAACYDCHSYETRWPWYSQIAPVSWLVAKDVREGREQMNFSTIGAADPEEQRDALRESARQVQRGEMPLEIYVKMHADARLTEADRELLKNWFREAAKRARE